MANINAPFGLRPVRYLNGAPWTGQARAYYCPSTYGTALYLGDPVLPSGTGNVAAFNDYGIGMLNGAIIAVVGTTNLTMGPVVAVLPVNRESAIYKPASTESIIMVADDPNLIFEMQDDGSSAAIGAAGVGLNFCFAAGSGGSTATGYSSWQIDAGGVTPPASTVGFQGRILGLAKRQNNDATAVNAVWDVIINQHVHGKNTVGY